MASHGIHGAVDTFAELPSAAKLDLNSAFIVRQTDGTPSGAGIYRVVKTASGKEWDYLDDGDSPKVDELAVRDTMVLYVSDSSGNDSTATGTEYKPYKTIQAAINQAAVLNAATPSHRFSIQVEPNFGASSFEDLTLNREGLKYLEIVARGTAGQMVKINSIRSTQYNDNFKMFTLRGFSVTGDNGTPNVSIEFQGESDETDAFTCGALFEDCFIYGGNCVLRNMVSASFKNCQVTSDINLENVGDIRLSGFDAMENTESGIVIILNTYGPAPAGMAIVGFMIDNSTIGRLVTVSNAEYRLVGHLYNGVLIGHDNCVHQIGVNSMLTVHGGVQFVGSIMNGGSLTVQGQLAVSESLTNNGTITSRGGLLSIGGLFSNNGTVSGNRAGFYDNSSSGLTAATVQAAIDELNSFTPADGDDWVDTDPATVKDALNRLAAFVAANAGTPVT